MSEIDHGNTFDWNYASKDYAKYRDIYPKQFYDVILQKGIATKGQRILDIGSGTGVLPRALYPYGAMFTGVDNSENQICYAKKLAQTQHMNIAFYCVPAETCVFENESFDAITAVQCFSYFQHDILAPHLSNMLKSKGKFMILYMAWLIDEDEIARKSEELILSYNPNWTGCEEVRQDIEIPAIYNSYFNVVEKTIYDVKVPFTRETWMGRIRSCRGVDAYLSTEKVMEFNREHEAWLKKNAPNAFDIQHYVAYAILEKKI